MFEINVPNVEEIGRNGRGRISVKINGYWSSWLSDPITVDICREYNNDGKWYTTLSHSCGGRDTEVVQDDLEAGINFANGMLALIEFSRKFMNDNTEQFEQYYQQEREEYRKAIAEKNRLKKEKIENDTVIGVDGATNLLNTMIKKYNVDTAKYSTEVHAHIRVRGSDMTHTVTFKNHGKGTFKLNSVRYSKNDLISNIATYAEVMLIEIVD